ncbi:MAG: PD40 domain-containing protein [Gemmatimonadaceae bacterium]|nr:PD40 domain-containing protein [Gemmatimonadaceae bacterium]
MRPFLSLRIAGAAWCAAVLIPTAAIAQSPPPPRAALAEPALSPDGREIAFVSGGDIWTVPADGGEARLMVAHPAGESRPLYSPDGTRLAFSSTRTGNGDIYVLTLATGQVQRLTYDDVAEVPGGWSRDGQWLYFNSASQDISGMQDVYRVRASGGTPMALAADRYASEFFGAPSPDGRTLAISARGTASGQWWRKGRSHIDEAEVWLVRDGGAAAPTYSRLTEDGGSKNLWPMWSPDGNTVYYMSDKSGQENLWSRAAAGGNGTQLTNFSNGRVLWPSISNSGNAIVFERDFAVWRYDVASKRAAQVAITLRGASSTRGTERQTLNTGFQFALSGDAKKLAIIGRGELWAADAREGGDATRLSSTRELETQPRWLRGDQAVVYVAWRADGGRLMRREVVAGTTRELTTTGDASTPIPSPDGRLIVYTKDGTELRVVNADGSNDRLLARGIFGRAPFAGSGGIAWSPDNQWVAFLTRGAHGFNNVHVVPAAGGEARPVSFLATSFSGDLLWHPDGRALYFLTSQRTEASRLIRVDLVPRTPAFREDRFRDLFGPRPTPAPVAPRDTAARPDTTTRRAATTPVRIVFDGIAQRASVLDPGIDLGSIAITPDGRTMLISSSGGGQPNLYTWSLDELSRDPATPRQLTTTAGFKSVVGFSADSRELWFTDAGRLQILPLAGGAARAVAVSAEIETDFHSDKWAAFDQAWTTQRDQFYDPKMHGANWEEVRTRFTPVVAAAQSPDEFRRILQLMVGELNASHSGASGPTGFAATPVGKMGVRFDRAAYEANGRYVIKERIALGPASISGLQDGDVIRSVNSTPLTNTINLDSLMGGTIGRRVELSIQRNNRDTTIALRPISTNAEKGLLYRQWVEERRAYVARVSNGRLGYVHMPDMSAEALSQLYVDLDAQNFARDGVVIDMRNNNGGFVNAYALDVFSRRGYMTMTTRGSVSVPARTQLGQRSLEKPTVLVVNQHTLSDGEDFTEGYRTLGLGPVVGEPTAGWIIYTSNVNLVDGTSLRVPFIRVDGADGKNMELVPRPVDVKAVRPVGESYSGRDSQLDAAVQALLAKLSR